MNKKILHIPNYYPPHIGGIEDVCHSIVAATPMFEHNVLCFNDKKETENDKFEGVPVTRLGVWKKLASQSVSFALAAFRKKIRQFNPEIIHFHTPNPLSSVYLLLSIPRKTKLIVHWHSDVIEQTVLYFFYRPIEKILLKRAEKIITTSPAYLSGSAALLPWKEKVTVIPNPINIEKLQKQEGDEEVIEEIKRQYGGKKIIFTFGRHVTYKGLEYLIESVPQISKDAVVLIAGKGPLSDSLKDSAKNLPTVTFLGRLDDAVLRRYLYAADVFAFPSITRNEAFGVALAEAMYCGLPAVTFTIPASGVNWVSIAGETGLEVENRNCSALAAAFNRLLIDDDLREKLGRNAAKRAADYLTAEAIRGDLMELYG